MTEKIKTTTKISLLFSFLILIILGNLYYQAQYTVQPKDVKAAVTEGHEEAAHQHKTTQELIKQEGEKTRQELRKWKEK